MPVLKIKQNGEWVDVAGGGAGSVDIDLEGSNVGTPNGINADTLDGRPASDYALKTDLDNIESSVGKPGAGEGSEVFNCYEDTEHEEVYEYVYEDEVHTEVYTYPLPANKALGKYAHAEGAGTLALGEFSHAEGFGECYEAIISGDANTTTYTYDLYLSDVPLSEDAVIFVKDIFATVTSVDYSDEAWETGIVTFTVSNTLSTEPLEKSIAHCYWYSGAIGFASHTEGRGSYAFGESSHAEGDSSAIGYCSHAEGSGYAAGNFSHAEVQASAYENNSHAEGFSESYGEFSHAEGYDCVTVGRGSHVEGGGSCGSSLTVSGEPSALTYVFEYNPYSRPYAGYIAHYNDIYSVVTSIDYNNNTFTVDRTLSTDGITNDLVGFTDLGVAYGGYSHAEGRSVSVGEASHAEGNYTIAYGDCSHAEGSTTKASGYAHHAQGAYNILDENSLYLHIVGNGSSGARSNAHTIDWTGNAVFAGTVSAPGADYAEHFEWLDGNPNNEDRVGTIVALDHDKIRPATPDDEILGVVSGTAMVIGDNAEWEWQGKFLTDGYGRVITEMVEEFIDIKDPETGEVKEKKSVGFIKRRKLNPEWNANQEYARRADRPEWDVVGLFGKLHVTDDGTCVPNGWATVGEDGKATASATKTNMRVMKRIEDNIVLVFMK